MSAAATSDLSTASITFSCLCVTEDRPEFTNWLMWNYDKQDYPHRELVVVDSSRGPLRWPERDDVRVIRCPQHTTVAAKRNIALEHAKGDVITWFDDDDWQHPRKLSILAAASKRSSLIGTTHGWFVNLQTGRARQYTTRDNSVIFNSVGVLRDVAVRCQFDPARRRASDTLWLAEIRRLAGPVEACDEQLFFWLTHDRNLSNPSNAGHGYRHGVDAVRSSIGDADWGETTSYLSTLGASTVGKPPDGRRADESSPPSLALSRDELCVVITTFDRADSLGRLLDDIEAASGDRRLHVCVFDDASGHGYVGIAERLVRRGWQYVRAEANHGKRGWWSWWNTILGHLRATPYERFIVLQDDMRLCQRFFERAEHEWSRIHDARKASLFLLVDSSSAETGSGRWTEVPERDVNGTIRCGWVDMNGFICERRLFDALDWQLHQPSARWAAHPLRSSGVGAQISTRLNTEGLTMYRVASSLLVHSNTPSLMNPEARIRWPLSTVRFVDGEAAAAALAQPRDAVFASLATVPRRVDQLSLVVEALVPQVDALRVYLNGYDNVPSFLHDRKIEVADSRVSGDRGDAGKFAWAGSHAGYILTCDDDLAYPPDYVERIVDGIQRYGRRAVVGFHGVLLREPIAEYHRSRVVHHFGQTLDHDIPVHVLGTGTVGFHSSTITVRPGDFAQPNVADLYLGLLGQRQHTPFVCLRRATGWLRELSGTRSGSIFEQASRSTGNRTSPATELARSIPTWTIYPPSAIAATSDSQALQSGPHASDLVRVDVTGQRRNAWLRMVDGDHITGAVQRTGTYYERDLLDAIGALSRIGTYVDVGAHYGNHTLFFALECQATQVISIEPNRAAIDTLTAMMHDQGLSDRVTALGVAIHPNCDRLEMRPQPWAPGRRRARTNSGAVTAVPSPQGTVEGATLDAALDSFTDIAVVKIDTCGSDLEVLASGWETIARDLPAIAIATSESENNERVRTLLEPLGYDLVGRYCWSPTWLWAPSGTAQWRARLANPQ